MKRSNLKIGDRVRVIGYRSGVYARGAVDEMRTEELFKGLVGQSFAIEGFDDYGHIELHPKRGHAVWIEPDLVEPLN